MGTMKQIDIEMQNSQALQYLENRLTRLENEFSELLARIDNALTSMQRTFGTKLR